MTWEKKILQLLLNGFHAWEVELSLHLRVLLGDNSQDNKQGDTGESNFQAARANFLLPLTWLTGPLHKRTAHPPSTWHSHWNGTDLEESASAFSKLMSWEICKRNQHGRQISHKRFVSEKGEESGIKLKHKPWIDTTERTREVLWKKLHARQSQSDLRAAELRGASLYLAHPNSFSTYINGAPKHKY